MRPWFESPELLKMVAEAGLEGGMRLREVFRSDWDAAELSKKADQAHQLALRQYQIAAVGLVVALLAAIVPPWFQLLRGEPPNQPFRFESTTGFLLRHNTATGQSCVYHSFSGAPPEMLGMQWYATQDRARTP